MALDNQIKNQFMILSEDAVKKIKGLSDAEVLKLLAVDGHNELPTGEKRNIFKIIAEVFKEPMFALLIASSGVYLFLGSVDEALILLASVVLIWELQYIRKIKLRNALEALRDMASPELWLSGTGSKKEFLAEK